MFIPYCANFPSAVALNRAIQERAGVAAITATFAKDQQGAVEKHMSKPLQHISKLPALIQKVLDLTAPEHPDQSSLRKGMPVYCRFHFLLFSFFLTIFLHYSTD